MQLTPILKCLVVDDEPIAIEGIIDFIAKVDFLEFTHRCSSALQIEEILKTETIDLMFLDINMPYLSGLEFLETVKNPPITIITTAYSEYALEGYRLQVEDYLLKPIAFNRFYQAVNKAFNTFKLNEPNTPSILPEDDFVYIRQTDGFEKIDLKKLRYIESMQNYAVFHFADKKKIVHQTMISLEEILPKTIFFRVHKSYIINLNHIESIQGFQVLMQGIRIPISRTKKDELLHHVVYQKLISK